MNKKKKTAQSNRYAKNIDVDWVPGSEGGISDEESLMESRGSDMLEQELEIEEVESVKRKRDSVEQGSMDNERERAA